ncbi:hypothetical protein [Actinoplanes couchii]|uniref:DUF4034 domain-containing protein n=1 Tax=Actinoplanes couchii TaxID=403638 RepID=A0ABQ3XFX7_9ACTN|nr:hypothetical protein [Actinoplanes couchii]MDR6320888.1 hypothetical protein [Actinoplanes couchii]GID57401.1 hypothetical protein Aco03nite_058050 [Actinoplanes couchii]
MSAAPAWHPDPYRNARIALQQGDTAPALHLLGAARGDAEARIHALDTLSRSSALHRLPQLEAQLATEPSNADLLLLVGALQQQAAWDARGAAYISHTSADQINGLMRHMVRARTSLRRVTELLPDDPAPWYELMGCAMAAQDYHNEPHDMWNELVRRGGDVSYAATRLRMTTLTAKWHGSREECFAFARERTRNLTPGHPLYALIPLVHIEEYVSQRSDDKVLTRVRAVFRYFSRRPVREEIEAASDALMAAADTFATHTASPAAHQAFGYVFDDRGDLKRARRHLERSGDEAIWPWLYFGDDDWDLFDKARMRADLPRLPRP